MSGEAGVKVFCRFRPFNKREIELGADKAVDFQFTPNSCKLEEGGRKYEFPFDYCWDGMCLQVRSHPARPRGTGLASLRPDVPLRWTRMHDAPHISCGAGPRCTHADRCVQSLRSTVRARHLPGLQRHHLRVRPDRRRQVVVNDGR